MAKSIWMFFIGGVLLFGGLSGIVKAVSEQETFSDIFSNLELIIEVMVYFVFIYFASVMIRQAYQIRKEKLKI